MTNDPIVDEIHQVREKLLAECDGDIDKYFDLLKQNEVQDKDHIISINELRNQPSLAH